MEILGSQGPRATPSPTKKLGLPPSPDLGRTRKPQGRGEAPPGFARGAGREWPSPFKKEVGLPQQSNAAGTATAESNAKSGLTCHGRLILALLLCAAIPALSADLPKIEHPVNDYAKVLSPAATSRIEELLKAHREKTGVQIAVLTVDTTGDLPLEDFSLKTAEGWGGGSRGKDDGVLFTLAVKDRTMRIEVGYGLEPLLPDAKALDLQEAVKDNLRSEDYDGAVESVVLGIVKDTSTIVAGRPLPRPAPPLGTRVPWTYLIVFLLGSIGTAILLLQEVKHITIPVKSLLPALFFGVVPAAIGAVFWGGPGFWWVYPIVYFVGMVLALFIYGAYDDSKWCAWAFGAWLYVLSPAYLIWNQTFHKLDKAEGPEVFTLLMAHVLGCGCGSLLGPLPYFLHLMGKKPSTGSGSSFHYHSGSFLGLGRSFGGGGGSSSWSGGGGSFGGGGASSSW